MTDKITLTPYMRALLVKEICRRMDIIEYSMRILYIYFERGTRDSYTGNCPYCFEQDTFTLNKNTGRCYCRSCGNEGDFLGLMSHRKGQDLDSTLTMLTGYLEEKKRWETAYAGGVV